MVPAVSFQPELPPEMHASRPFRMFRRDFDGIQILSMSFNLLRIHGMDLASSGLLLRMTEHCLDHRG